MKRFFLGLAANYSKEDRRSQLFSLGRKEDLKDLEHFLLRKYNGERAILTKNGRSALTLALKAYFNKGDKILVNGFTCYAVYEAVKAADLDPVFVDINKDDLNFDIETLNKISDPAIKGIIIQNTLGFPVDIAAIEQFAKKHDLVIIEDLAHCAGVKYQDGREAGTVGAAAVLSFGKDKSIDTVSGGAVVLRHPCQNKITAPSKSPKLSDHLRARFYPTFGAICRVLTHVHLGGILMKCLVKIHWVEKSADNKLDISRKPSKFEARRALIQIKSLNKSGEKPIREFYLVKNRDEVLKKLKKSGFYFDGFWYEKPISPARYYQKTNFPEEECKNAVYISEHIINLPTYYRKNNLKKAREIIEKHLEDQA
ncbi:aminotransferase class I/II-fold pyridoxal phosphate-dependent enzyme [Candidatus Saccharibacteria bacterium]|nr:aminotransferase class I/II-fold pyridoxal phosphate-dependent enzyme [Candidatus Saccharibacteria bacterium]